MLLCFSLGDERFALDAKAIREVVPLVQLKKIPNAPTWVAGIMRYHSHLVPVIDLCALNMQRPAERYMSTRIMVIDFTTDDGSNRLLGLLAEKVTEILQCRAEEFSDDASGGSIRDIADEFDGNAPNKDDESRTARDN